jgi:hypothetical protein
MEREKEKKGTGYNDPTEERAFPIEYTGGEGIIPRSLLRGSSFSKATNKLTYTY